MKAAALVVMFFLAAAAVLLAVFSCTALQPGFVDSSTSHITLWHASGLTISSTRPGPRDRKSVAAAAWEIAFNGSRPIPMQLWQTSRSWNISSKAQGAMRTWKVKNPDVTHTLHDDEAAASFIKQVYGQEVHDLFRSFPLGVMRGDFWRYAVLYAYGGVYADLDTWCFQPIKSWMPPREATPKTQSHLLTAGSGQQLEV